VAVLLHVKVGVGIVLPLATLCGRPVQVRVTALLLEPPFPELLEPAPPELLELPALELLEPAPAELLEPPALELLEPPLTELLLAVVTFTVPQGTSCISIEPQVALTLMS